MANLPAVDAQISLAVLSDVHLPSPGTRDGQWNNPMRLSASRELLEAALAEIVAAGYDRVVVLGDVSEQGTHDTISAALQAMSRAGLESWIVPGNHDVRLSADALSAAVDGCPGSSVLRQRDLGPIGSFALIGHGLRSEDGGKTCWAGELPDLDAVAARMLVWISHYPVVSQQARLQAYGLRYPGDLLNLGLANASLGLCRRPVLVLHGHLHTTLVWREGSILQIGVPAVIEWPHAWTEISVQLGKGKAARVRAAMRSISGRWSTARVNTVLDKLDHAWVLVDGRWVEAEPR